jgi:hypothetical protein
MPLNLVEIIKVKFPGEIEKGNITFRKPLNQEILLDKWNVPNIERPLESDLMAESVVWEPIKNYNDLEHSALNIINDIVHATAVSKKYDSPLSICSYINSSNARWAAEAQAFIQWRDEVFAYTINIINQVQQGLMEFPTIEKFMDGVPNIVWPN